MARALAFSCNTAYVNASETYTDGDMDEAAEAFGMTASVAAEHAVTPILIEGRVTPPAAPARPLTPDETEQLRAMMDLTITQGSATMLQGVLRGAKTGTAEYVRDGELLTHISLTGYTNSDLAVWSAGRPKRRRIVPDGAGVPAPFL